MNNTQLIGDYFGKRYRLLCKADGLKATRLGAISFMDIACAKRFIRRMHVAHGYWRRVLDRYGHNTYRKDTDEVLNELAYLLVAKKMYFCEVEKLNRPLSFSAQNTFKNTRGEQCRFMPAKVALGGAIDQIQHFSSEQSVYEYFKTFSVSEAQLSSVAETLESSKLGLTKESSGKKDIIQMFAAALLKGELVVLESKVKPPRAKKSAVGALEETATLPGSRVVEAPPGAAPSNGSSSPPAAVSQEPSQASQAAALVVASQRGAAFCEECS